MRKTFSISGGAICSADGASQDVYKASKRACQQYKEDRHQELLNDPELVEARKTLFLAYNKPKVDTKSVSYIRKRYTKCKICWGHWSNISDYPDNILQQLIDDGCEFA